MDSFPGFDPVRARRWCLDLAGCSAAERINRDDGPYLVRYWYVAGWRPMMRGPASAVFLHHFVNSDPPGSVHSHPWAWSSSLILVGGYRDTLSRRGRRRGRPGLSAWRRERPGNHGLAPNRTARGGCVDAVPGGTVRAGMAI